MFYLFQCYSWDIFTFLVHILTDVHEGQMQRVPFGNLYCQTERKMFAFVLVTGRQVRRLLETA